MNFAKAEELPGETLDAFVIRLRTLARDCESTNVDNEIKAQITQKCRSSKVRRRSFLDGIILKEVLDHGCAMGTAEQEAIVIEAGTRESVNKVYVRKLTKPFSVRPKTTTTFDIICGNCGGVYPHKRQLMVNSAMCVEGTIILHDAADYRQVRVRFHLSNTANFNKAILQDSAKAKQPVYRQIHGQSKQTCCLV